MCTEMSSNKPTIVAERFKSKLCRTFCETGACPYEARCMFAHGDADLRTAAMNVADGLTTEETIRAFQRNGNKVVASKAAKKPAAAPSPKASHIRASQATPMPSPAASATSDLPCDESTSFESSIVESAVSPVPEAAVTPRNVISVRRNNPYAPIPLPATLAPAAASQPTVHMVSPLAAAMLLSPSRMAAPVKTVEPFVAAPAQSVVLLA